MRFLLFAKNTPVPSTHLLTAPTLAEIDALQALYRENVKLAEEEHNLLNEEPADLIKNLGILSALRTASEKEPSRATAPSKIRKPKAQAPKLDMDGAADSPGPSPSMSTSASRLKGVNTARSGSVASVRDGKEGKKTEKVEKVEEKEVGVKIEEGSEGAKGPSAERAGKFFVGAEVAYKQAKMKEDGSQWIQCIILGIDTTNTKKRYVYQTTPPPPPPSPFLSLPLSPLLPLPLSPEPSHGPGI